MECEDTNLHLRQSQLSESICPWKVHAAPDAFPAISISDWLFGKHISLKGC
jgi:hypothetical protein